MDDVHFHTRYVVLDIACSGVNPETDKLLSIAASTVRQATILPEDAFFLDLAAQGGDIATTLESAAGTTVDQQLMAFLQFTAKAPIITYHVPYVGGFLQRTFKERLGIDFQPQWIDLALLLPALFDEKSDVVKPLDFWIDSFGLYAGNGRRSAMENTLMLARLFQMSWSAQRARKSIPPLSWWMSPKPAIYFVETIKLQGLTHSPFPQKRGR